MKLSKEVAIVKLLNLSLITIIIILLLTYGVFGLFVDIKQILKF